jgi:hypothetical protein
MSEYQYYEFTTLDRRLTQEQMRDLRQISSRAEITPTRLTNVYHFGDFRGDPSALMRDYFDAMVYVTNWATRQFMVRVPRRAVDAAAIQPYTVPDFFTIDIHPDHVVLDFNRWSDDGEDWGEWQEGEAWMPQLASVRSDLLRGDRRSWYIGWLLGAQCGEVEETAVEPPVPPGLGDLPPGLAELVEFLHIDRDLVAAAAETSPDPGATTAGLADWIASLPEAEKNRLLREVVESSHAAEVAAELLQRFRADVTALDQSTGIPATGTTPRRTVAELRAAMERAGVARRAAEARRTEAERVRRAIAAAAAKETRLVALATRGDKAWLEAERWIESRTAEGYADAAQRLGDLRDLADRSGDQRAFRTRYLALREQHARKHTFIRALRAEGFE